jgi:predicted metal-dependent hydrolase
MAEYTLIRSKRKTVALYVRDGKAEVRAPLSMPLRDIDKFVSSKSGWLSKRLSESKELLARRGDFSVNYASLLAFRGALYPVKIREGDRAGFDGVSFYMPPGLSPERLKSACVKLYRLLAKRHLTERTRAFSERMSLKPSGVKINGAKTRWGSCSAAKSVNFSWRLIMADDALIDYVVAHELAHLKEMNHSPRFWATVESAIPDYRERKIRLKAFQDKIDAEDWD